jgi:hypothetical protein
VPISGRFTLRKLTSALCQKQTPLSARKDIRWPSVAKPQAFTSKEEAIARACRLCLKIAGERAY